MNPAFRFSALRLLSIPLAGMILSIGLSNGLMGQEWARKMFSELNHDFGTVAKNEKAEHVFEITNLYEEDMTIANVKSSCSCTDLELDNRVLKSKEVARLVAKFNTRSFVGLKQATVTVKFAPPFVGEVQLTVRGNIRNDVMFEPGEIDFGSITQDSLVSGTHSRQVQLTKFNNPTWRVVDVKSTFPHIGVSFDGEPVRFGNQVKYKMNVRLKESAPPGYVQGELIIVADDFGGITEIPIKFAAKVASALQISPEVITINTPSSSTVKKNAVVKASTPFRIKSVTCPNASFAFKFDSNKSSKVHFVEVYYSADQPPGRYECDLDFVTDLNQETAGSIKAVVEIAGDNGQN